MYHIIGDIHGYANELEYLLKKMGYLKSSGVYQHPEAKAIFVGDFIDRGPKIREVLDIVRPMIEEGHAYSVMGNHEYNALCYQTYCDELGDFLRPHTEKNTKQFSETIKQLGSDLEDYLKWFWTLPVYLDFDKFRVVHACWDINCISIINKYLEDALLKPSILKSAHIDNTKLNEAFEIVLKGKELQLPAGDFFLDKDGHKRSELRIQWFREPTKNESYSSFSFPPDNSLSAEIIDKELFQGLESYTNKKPVFFGHYWLNNEMPKLFSKNAVCVDFSVAKDGFLSAYKFDGSDITEKNFIISR